MLLLRLMLLAMLHRRMMLAEPADYGIQTGHISVSNDSEITILINSTFEIIEDFDNETHVESTTTAPAPAPEMSTKEHKVVAAKMKRLRPIVTSSCQKYTEAEKYKLLEAAGGRNQLFMADSVDEAAHNFADSFPPSSAFPSTLDDAIQVEMVQGTPPCDPRCQSIKAALNEEIVRRAANSSTRTAEPRVRGRIRAVFSDAPPVSCALLGNFIPVGVCSELGEPVDGGSHESLCSECRGLFMLAADCFPRIFNAVQCNSQEMGCIFDTFTDMAHGQCDVQTLSFKVLRNAGDSSCEEWIVEQIQLPVACQCSLSKSSFLRAKPVKEL